MKKEVFKKEDEIEETMTNKEELKTHRRQTIQIIIYMGTKIVVKLVCSRQNSLQTKNA